MRKMDIAETGSATANHFPQSRGGSMCCRAIRFWGDDIGELWPPTFAARAMANYMHIQFGSSSRSSEPTMRQGANVDFGGRVLKIG